MIRVKIDLVPFGDETMTKQIAEMVIANAGRNQDGNYRYVASYKDDKGNVSEALLSDHDRNQPVLELIRMVIDQMTFEEIDRDELKRLQLEEYLGKLKEKLVLGKGG